MIAGTFVAPAAFADVIYSTIPEPFLPNLPSLGYAATQTQEFGDLIQFAGGARNLTQVSVVMSNWAKQSDWTGVGSSTGYNQNLTLNLYNVGLGNTVGSLFATQTVSTFIPWRPEDSVACPAGQWQAGNGSCYSGLAFAASLDFSGVLAPNELIYGLAYNTIGAGPYDSLNFGLATVGPTVGSRPSPDTAYWNTANAANYTDGGLGGTNTFRQDTGWTPYSGAISFSAIPEPATVALIGIALAGVGFSRRKKA